MRFVLKKCHLFSTFRSRFLLAFSSAVFLLSSCAAAQESNEFNQEEIAFYQQNGIQPFVADEQDGDYPAGTYLVLHDLTIAKGRIMTLYPGTKILFVKDTRLIVNGLLICQGKIGDQVVFDKLDNRKYFHSVDTALDTWWEGIYISDSATVEMKHTSIRNSKNGITAKNLTASVSLDTVRFVNSKYISVRFGNDMPNISNNRPFNLMWSGLDGKKAEIIYTDTVKKIISDFAVRADGSTVQIMPQQPAERKKMSKTGKLWLTGILAVAGIGAGGYGLYYGTKYNDKYNLSQNRNPATADPTHVESQRIRGNTFFGTAVGGAALFVVGATGFILTLTY